MSILSGGKTDFFGLDIGSLGLRAVQLSGTGPQKSLVHYGEIAIDNTIASKETVVDPTRLKQSIQALLKQTGITTKKVAVNLPSSRVFTTIVEMIKLAPEEMAKTIRYQADTFIPTPLEKSKIDWSIIGDSPKDKTKVEVLLSSVPIEYVEHRMDLIEACGLDVIAMEPDNMALARSIIPTDAVAPQLVLDLGFASSDIVISISGTPHLARSIPLGSTAILKAASQNLGVDLKQAEQFVFKFGLSKDKLEGRVYNGIIVAIDSLISEIEKSVKYFAERYSVAKLDRIIVTGGASVIPELPLYIANHFGLNVEIGNAWRNVSVATERQNELLAVSNHYAVAVGLAERAI